MVSAEEAKFALNETELGNPYAPPQDVDRPLEEHRSEARLWRDGAELIVESGAQFEPICFVTGEFALRGVEVERSWVPAWLYLLLLPGVLPFFFVRPWFVQKISLMVPVSAKTYYRFRMRAKIGMGMFGVCVLLIVLGTNFVGAALLPAGVGGAILCGFILAWPAVPLRVRYANSEVIVLGRVHANCLENLPDWNSSGRH